MIPLQFAPLRENKSESWQRADPVDALLEQRAWNEWTVCLPDSDSAHCVQLETRNGGYVGECHNANSGERCKARKYNAPQRPCAHLVTIRKAAVLGDPDCNGNPVRVFSRERAERERADDAIEQAVADGGKVSDL